MTTATTRRSIYRVARVLGDVEAAEHGPGAYAKRRIRRVAYRQTNAALRRFLRSIGLSR